MKSCEEDVAVLLSVVSEIIELRQKRVESRAVPQGFPLYRVRALCLVWQSVSVLCIFVFSFMAVDDDVRCDLRNRGLFLLSDAKVQYDFGVKRSS